MRTLLIDPIEESRDALRRGFAAAGEQVRSLDSMVEADRQVALFDPDILVVALDAPAGDPLAFVEGSALDGARRAVFVLLPSDGLDAAVTGMQRGAADFLWRPVSDARVSLLLSRLAEHREADRRAEELRVALVRSKIESVLAGRSPRWQAALAAIERAAKWDDPVLLAGEAGTEQEEAARALHGLSRRGAGPFLFPADLERISAAPVRAQRGTLYIPGVERRSARAQEALLDRIESERLRPIFSINESPEEAAASGKLSSRLYEAVRDRVVHLPPLREREGDVDLLARTVLLETDAALSFDAEALDALRSHDWPGNVRELREVVRRAAPLSDGPTIGPTVVLSLLAGPRARRRVRRKKPPVVKIAVGASLADVERRLIQKTLEFARGNKPKTAELLKLSLKTIYNKIKEYGLEH
ncbi:MAG TPA: helix-turn-helix domain-containing protein [Thermoanaerobaculia bacterium]|nr:helix-turn-helix domain-containing protein [Thermoanaerobaculia bacterium]